MKIGGKKIRKKIRKVADRLRKIEIEIMERRKELRKGESLNKWFL